MGLANELLQTAAALRSVENASQADIRRSISTAYYAVFHLLTDEASEMFIAGSGREQLRSAVRRTFGHERMASACKAFMSDRHKLSKLLKSTPPKELQEIGRAFLQLQEARHRADYDTGLEFDVTDALTHLNSAINLFWDWNKIKNTEDARVFLVALLLWKDLRD